MKQLVNHPLNVHGPNITIFSRYTKNVDRPNKPHSLLEHLFSNAHSYNFDNTKTHAHEPFKLIRNVLEMICIHKNKTINFRTDTD